MSFSLTAFNWQPCYYQAHTVEHKIWFYIFKLWFKNTLQNTSHKMIFFLTPSLCWIILPAPTFSSSFRCLKNFQQPWFVKIFSQAVSDVSHACQTAAFDSDRHTREYLQYVDLCPSWGCHFITSFSHHIDSGLFPSPAGWVNLVQGQPTNLGTEQCYKMKPNRPGPCKWFYLQGAILLRTDMIRCCGRDQ